MTTTPTNVNHLMIDPREDDCRHVLPAGQTVRSLESNHTPSGNGRNDFPHDGRLNVLDSPLSAPTDGTPPPSKKPHLEARWVDENGKLVCKWSVV
ncbi:hypothetical protein [Stenomitos frigidus]|uniref:Uncharacterized protein n=1 Tax=Stenomitos frigidus ULC18 TaxID=2107698 RepID=A0A2T1E2Q7_9CYAN|nr:hypothetical protein [Stenomitos frigidus]PSB27015.1 hypothetical protein C7B82_17835 [Stenomitos frigidus ULC18]